MKTITFGKFNLALRFHLFLAVLLLGIAPLRSAEPVDNWAEYPRPEGAGALTSVAFGNGTFVAAGDDGTIVTSANGMDWTRINTTATTGPPHADRCRHTQ